MMAFLGFGAPAILIGLALLPLIWFLLRVTPPKPQREPFPPLKILKQIIRQETTAHKTPWWLALLRLMIAGLVIFALAQPMMQPRQLLVNERDPLVLMIDNGFAAKASWSDHLDVAKRLINEARHHDLPVYIVPTIEAAHDPFSDVSFQEGIGPYRASEALDMLDRLTVQPAFSDRLRAIRRWSEIAGMGREGQGRYQLAYLSDGLAGKEDIQALAQLPHSRDAPLLWYQGVIEGLVGLSALENAAQSLQVQGVRAASEAATDYLVGAYDASGRRLGEAEMRFASGQTQALATFSLPLEIRNDILSVKLEEVGNVAATYLVSSNDKRRRIGLLGFPPGEMVQPLLSPLYYPMQALAPFGDLIKPRNVDLARQMAEILDANPALIVMGDEVKIPAHSRERLQQWIEAGGSLLRFSGPRLAASGGLDDAFLPVRLRRGERTMGGVMSWVRPQKIMDIAQQSPLFGLDVPDDVTVSRQILAVPEPQLFDKSWVTLEDGTPLVSGEIRGRGRVILIHTTASPDWSNLALSGFFVEMLHRFVMQANQPPLTVSDQGQTGLLPPWRILSIEGQLLPPPAFVQPLPFEPQIQARPDVHHPPGLYGHEEGAWFALNLLEPDQQFDMLEPPQDLPILRRDYRERNNRPLEGFLWALALILFTLDCLIMLLLKQLSDKIGKFAWSVWFRRKKSMPVVTMFAVLLLLPFIFTATQLQAQTSQDLLLSELAAKTHLAYVKTGNSDLDDLSASGLETLSQFITARTTISLGEVVAVDLARDELSFYPLLYWPIDISIPPPEGAAIARLAAYIQQGGSVLFDTRDQLTSGLSLAGDLSPVSAHLRAILADLDVPPLEPAPPDHVVARSFYIMPDFPGRYRGSPLWLEALPTQEQQEGGNIPIVRAGDGVSPILITANDFVGAWAQNTHSDWFYPTVPDDPAQRLWALRGGLNIVLYMLSGNYKADQVHAPELLQRLGEER